MQVTPPHDSFMEVAAVQRHHKIVRRLAIECWQYTEPNTSAGAGFALDLAFDTLLYDDHNYKDAIEMMLPCWLRNDVTERKWAVHRTLLMAVRLTKQIYLDIDLRSAEMSTDEDTIQDLKRLARKAQLTAAALMQTLSVQARCRSPLISFDLP